MKALTLWQPWGWAIVAGKKPVENRPWKPHASIIGQTIAIHAGKVYDHDGVLFLEKCGVTLPKEARVASAVIGTCRVDGYVELGQLQADPILEHPMFFGPIGWKISEPQMLETPVSCKGALSLWRLPVAVESAVLAQLRKAA